MSRAPEVVFQVMVGGVGISCTLRGETTSAGDLSKVS